MYEREIHAADLGDLRASGWMVDAGGRSDAAEGQYASLITQARTGLANECLAAFERCGVPLRWLSLFREEGSCGRRRVAALTGRCPPSRVEAALAEIAAPTGPSRVVSVRRVRRRL